MSAHVVTALAQLKGEILNRQLYKYASFWDGLQAALDYSTWTEQLTLDDYRALQAAVETKDSVALAHWVGCAEYRYTELWWRLGQPATREDWVHLEWMQRQMVSLFGLDHEAHHPVTIRFRNTERIGYLCGVKPGQQMKGVLYRETRIVRDFEYILDSEDGREIGLNLLDFELAE